MRNYILKHYLKRSAHSVVVGHHGSVHFRNFLLSLGLTILIWVIYVALHYFFPDFSSIKWIALGLILLCYIRFLLRFFNLYLDALVIDKSGISLFLRNKIFSYSVQYCHRDHIEDIAQGQDSFDDKLFNKGDISFTLNNGTTISFTDITHPKKTAELLWNQKIQFESPHSATQAFEDGNNDKFEILVETLGEVIKDYMGKGKPPTPPKVSNNDDWPLF